MHPQPIDAPMDTFVNWAPRENIPPRTQPAMTTMAHVQPGIFVKMVSKHHVLLENTKIKHIKVHVKIVLLVSFVMQLVLKHLLTVNVLLEAFVSKEPQWKKHVPKELTEAKLEQEALQIASRAKVVTSVVQALPNLMTVTYVPLGITVSSVLSHRTVMQQ